MKTLLRLTVLLLALASGLAAAEAKAPEVKLLVNVDKHGVGIQGYDPVAFFTRSKPVQGLPGVKSTYHGVTYQFANVEDKKLFDADPAKYEPQFGGYCAYGVSRDRTVDIDINAFQIVDGRLLMQYSKSIRDDFNEDTQANLKLADKNWPDLVKSDGKLVPASTLAPASPPATTSTAASASTSAPASATGTPASSSSTK